MKKEFSKMSVFDALHYLEELDYEASILNKSTEDLLTKAKLNNKISKDVFNLLYNTLQSMKKGEIKINGEVVRPYEKKESVSKGIQFAVPVEEAIPLRSGKELGGWLDNLTDWEVEHFNEKGTEFVSLSKSGDTFSFNLSKKEISVGSYTYKLGSDFDHILNVPEQGIYLFKKSAGTLEGVTMIRYSTESEVVA